MRGPRVNITGTHLLGGLLECEVNGLARSRLSYGGRMQINHFSILLFCRCVLLHVKVYGQSCDVMEYSYQ